MPEVLQEREPSRRPVVVVAVLLAALVAVAAFRVVSGAAGPGAAAGGSPPSAAGASSAALSTTGSFGSATDNGEYAYATRLRSSAPVTVLHVTPLDSNGWVMDPVVAAAVPGTDYNEPLALRAQPAVAPLDVAAGAEFVVVVRIRPDCSSPRPLATLRVSLRLADGREVLRKITLDVPDARLPSLPAAVCEQAAGPVGSRPVVELTGAGGGRYFSEDVHSYESGVRSVWPVPVTVFSVVRPTPRATRCRSSWPRSCWTTARSSRRWTRS